MNGATLPPVSAVGHELTKRLAVDLLRVATALCLR